jgi:membrane protease YdiL (CAAX protease family)
MWWILKVLSFFSAILGLSFIFSLLVSLRITKALPREPSTGKLNIKIDPWILTLVTLGTSLAMVQYLDHRPLASLGLHFYSSWWIELALGVVWGSAMLIVMATLLWIFSGQNPFVKFSMAKYPTLPSHLRGSLVEELAIRGYPFQILVGTIGVYPAILVTSAFFGLLHYQSQGLLGAVNTGLVGLLLATAALKTKALWLAVGVHFGWNFAEALFGLEGISSRERYLAEIVVVIVSWFLLMALPIQPHPEMERLWNGYIVHPKPQQ